MHPSTTTYTHARSASFASRALKWAMSFIGMKKGIEWRMTTNRLQHKPATIPGALRRDYDIQTATLKGRPVWTLKPRQGATAKTILYIHGGAYISNISFFHWSLIGQLLKKTGATIIVPDYPLAPNETCTAVYDFIGALYKDLLTHTAPEDIIFMGDSAGGGFILGFAQKLRNDNLPQPGQIIALAPWLDVTMSNPDVAAVDHKDKMLGIKGLQAAGGLYTGELDAKDYRVSPIFGSFEGLGKISVFIGTHDLFIADSRKLKAILDDHNIAYNYYEYLAMFHVWMAVTWLRESKAAVDQIAALVKA